MRWGNRAIWITSIVSSLVLLGLVLWQIDLQVAREVISNARGNIIVIGVGLLVFEGFVTAARFKLLALGRVTYRQCLTATAWYVLLLLALPARLGEVAGVAIMVRDMGQRAGTAVASLLLQRMFDVIVLAAMLSIIAAFAVTGGDQRPALYFGLAIITMLVCAIVFMDRILGFVAVALKPRKIQKWPRRILRIVLQIRMVLRHQLTREMTFKLGLLTLLKWAITLLAIAFVVVAVTPQIAFLTALGVGVAYNLAAIVPVQTIGGFGISEVVLLGSFKWLGYSVALGASLAVAVRLVLLTAPLLFWGIVMGYLALSQNFAARDE